jgi:lipopolysaccharide heptosyltransferase II
MKSNSKTLVIRFSSIGDVVLATPLLRALRARFPDGQIDFVTRVEYAELIRSNHNLNLTYPYDASTGVAGLLKLQRRLRAERYDLVVDIHGSLRSRLLTLGLGAREVVRIDKRVVERFLLVRFKNNNYREIVPVADRYLEPLAKLGIRVDGKGPELHIPDEVLFGVSGKVATLRLNRYECAVGLCPSARHATKRWPADRYAALGIRLAQDHGAKILLFGGADDVPLTSTIAAQINEAAGNDRATDYAGALSLLETAAAMEFCDAVVTNDTGLMHMAAAMKRNVVAIFGSTVREFGFFPFGETSVVLERAGLYCRPCSHVGRNHCPEGHFRCMLEIEVDQVLVAVERALHRTTVKQ